MLKSVIVDDESDARTTLSNFIKKYCNEIQLAGVADGVKNGVELIKKESPDIIFLDIRMMDGTGFDLLDKLNSSDAHVIFTTAYEEFALRAIKYSAIDYLLKPIDPDELIEAVKKACAAKAENTQRQKYDLLKKNLQQPAPTRLVISDMKGLTVVDPEEITRCQSNDNYTVIHLQDKSQIVATRTLKDFEELLSAATFFRIHHSHLVNLKHVKRFIKDGGFAVMSDDAEVEISRRRKNDFIERLSSL